MMKSLYYPIQTNSIKYKPKPNTVTTTYLYQHKWQKARQQQTQRQQSLNINSIRYCVPVCADEEQSEKPSMCGLALPLDTDDPLSANRVNRLSITSAESGPVTTLDDMDDEKFILSHPNKQHQTHTKAQSELIFSNSCMYNTQHLRNSKRTKNPAAMLNAKQYSHTQHPIDLTTSCIHSHYASPSKRKPSLFSATKLNLLTHNLLQYRVIHCGYLTKRSKLLRKWKRRFALLLCAKMSDHYQFKLLYFDSDTLSKFKGGISFTNRNQIGLIAPKESFCKEDTLCTPLLPEPEMNHSESVSISVSMAFNHSEYSALWKQNPTCPSVSNVWSSFPSHYGFYLADTRRDSIWYLDANNEHNAHKWLFAIWNIGQYFTSKIPDKYNVLSLQKSKPFEFTEKTMYLKQGFSDFVEIEMDGYCDNTNRNNMLIDNIKYMMIIPNSCCMRFKGILLLDCIYKGDRNNKRLEPTFRKEPHKIRMKQQSLFVDTNDDTYFELVGDLMKCFCNARDREAKLLWKVALQHYTNSIF
eukprot:1035304_1